MSILGFSRGEMTHFLLWIDEPNVYTVSCEAGLNKDIVSKPSQALTWLKQWPVKNQTSYNQQTMQQTPTQQSWA